MSHPLDLRRLRHLRAAVVEGSLTGAAARLGVSQPTLSESIRSLEADLGVRLLERHRHGVSPTRCAEAIVGHAQSIEQELEAAWSQVARSRSGAAASVRIGCGPSEAARLLPAALRLLRERAPTLRVFVEYGLNEMLMPMVRRGDVACALSSIPRSVTHPDLTHEPLHVDSAVVVARVGHPLSTRRTLAPRDLAAFPWVLARQWELERRALDELFAEAGLPPVEPAVETTSAILMKTLLMQGDFLTFVPHEMIHWEEAADQLRPLKGFRSSWQRHVGITTRRGEAPAPPMLTLVQCLHEVAAGFVRRPAAR
jgi:DNA-binding transcriptional LysR family regulator